ncbi:hypothetical protein GGR56DRAFT_631308 [Xylariaceae sp. FL0804]|nr:hypothetical protein GGR56DRAFT_631308 [Xylariaceae sp. FL0804]
MSTNRCSGGMDYCNDGQTSHEASTVGNSGNTENVSMYGAAPQPSDEPQPGDKPRPENMYRRTRGLLPTTVPDRVSLSPAASKKRKQPSPSAQTALSVLVASKKAKTDKATLGQLRIPVALGSDKSCLPAEIWHYVFTFLPPKALGNLLCTNRLFHTYLDLSSPFHCSSPASLNSTLISKSKPEAIWQASRRGFWPEMPSPLRGKSELEMWRFACQQGCQFCDKVKPDLPSPPSNPWQTRPDSDGYRVIWSFAIRCCRHCLFRRIIKEVDLLLSPSMPSFLIPALPMIFIADDMHVILSASLQNDFVPGSSTITKAFLQSDVEMIKREFFAVKEIGSAVAEEWLKGLENRGKEHQRDAMRWEKWDLSGGLSQMRIYAHGPSSSDTLPAQSSHMTEISAARQTSSDFSKRSNLPPPAAVTTVLAQCEPAARTIAHRHHLPVSRACNKTLDEITELKAARCAEIERRARELDPPLIPEVLARIPSFRAAIRIPRPLDDDAWSLIRPHLVAQRAEAERQGGISCKAGDVPEHSRERGSLSRAGPTSKRQVSQATTQPWELPQSSPLTRILSHANDYIRDNWDGGEKVTMKTAPDFAAGVLLDVRNKFYAQVAEDAAAARAAGHGPIHDPPEGPFAQKLTLKDMKYLYAQKIEPHILRLCGPKATLFFCSTCTRSKRTYGFAAVLDHFVDVHDKSLDSGPTARWQAEWPEACPLRPNPGSFEALSNPPLEASSKPLFKAPPKAPQPMLTGQEALVSIPTSGQPSQHQSGHVTQHYGYAPPYHHLPLSSVAHSSGSSNCFGSKPTLYDLGLASYPTGSASDDEDYTSQGNGSVLSPPQILDNWSPSYHTKLEDLTLFSKRTWSIIKGLKELPRPIQVRVALAHISARFRSRFFEGLPLELFADCLKNRKKTHALHNITGLVCKACKKAPGHDAPGSQDKSFTLPQLVHHFQQQHVQETTEADLPPLDWSVDMIYLPDLSALFKLQNTLKPSSKACKIIFGALRVVGKQPDGGPKPVLAQDREKRPKLENTVTVKSEVEGTAPIPEEVSTMEGIHAMWAVDRKEIVRLPFFNQPGAPTRSSEAHTRSSPRERGAFLAPQGALNPSSPATTACAEGHGQQTVKEEEDLMAGLEFQLEQQASTAYRNHQISPKVKEELMETWPH